MARFLYQRAYAIWSEEALMARGAYANSDAGALALPGGGGMAVPGRAAATSKNRGLARLPVAAKAIAVTAIGLLALTLILALTAVSTVRA
ncbi:MAG: hypothetical protein WDO24_06580 [Pseudomonadota bacterium]